MKIILTTLLILLFFATNAYALAANQDGGNQSQNSSDTTQNREENQERTNNPETGTMTEEQTQFNNAASNYVPQNQATQQHAAQVQSTVQNMIQLSYQINNESLGNQIRTMAQEQINSEDNANQALEKAQMRSNFAKFFVGADYAQLKIVKQEMEQNQLRIQALQQMCDQISNESDRTELKNQLQTLEEQNISLQDQLRNEESGFSLFGWIIKFINNY
jgi:hypothetical protein